MDVRVSEFAVAEAKAKFSELVARAEAGEQITIRRHGKVVAKLVPSERGGVIEAAEERRRLVARWAAYRREHGPTLGAGLTVRDLIEEGRRY